MIISNMPDISSTGKTTGIESTIKKIFHHIFDVAAINFLREYFMFY